MATFSYTTANAILPLIYLALTTQSYVYGGIAAWLLLRWITGVVGGNYAYHCFNRAGVAQVIAVLAVMEFDRTNDLIHPKGVASVIATAALVLGGLDACLSCYGLQVSDNRY